MCPAFLTVDKDMKGDPAVAWARNVGPVSVSWFVEVTSPARATMSMGYQPLCALRYASSGSLG